MSRPSKGYHRKISWARHETYNLWFNLPDNKSCNLDKFFSVKNSPESALHASKIKTVKLTKVATTVMWNSVPSSQLKSWIMIWERNMGSWTTLRCCPTSFVRRRRSVKSIAYTWQRKWGVKTMVKKNTDPIFKDEKNRNESAQKRYFWRFFKVLKNFNQGFFFRAAWLSAIR